jgi:hypothetical protein
VLRARTAAGARQLKSSAARLNKKNVARLLIRLLQSTLECKTLRNIRPKRSGLKAVGTLRPTPRLIKLWCFEIGTSFCVFLQYYITRPDSKKCSKNPLSFDNSSRPKSGIPDQPSKRNSIWPSRLIRLKLFDDQVFSGPVHQVPKFS